MVRPMAPKRKFIATAAAALLLAAVLAFYWFDPALGFAMDPNRIESIIGTAGLPAACVSIGLMVLHSFVPLPAELIAIANGMVFGFWLGLAVTWAGAMAGAWLAYFVGLALGRPVLLKIAREDQVARAEGLMARHGVISLLVMRLIPVASFNLVNYAAGALKTDAWTFGWTTAIGILPVSILSVLAGSHMVALPWQWNVVIFAGLVAAAIAGKLLLQRLASPRP